MTVKVGVYQGRFAGDKSEEVEAWKVQSKLSNAKDKLVTFAAGGVSTSIINKFDSAKSDRDKAQALSGLSPTYSKKYADYQENEQSYGAKFTLNGVPPGTTIRRSLKVGNGEKTYYGKAAK